MKYLVDTDRVADWLKGRQDAVRLLKGLAPEGLAISLITYGEIYEGIYRGRDPEQHERVFREFLRLVRVLVLNRPIMRSFARVRGDLRAQGQAIGDLDVAIAATALHYDLAVVTRNASHFRRVAGLQVLG